MGYADDWEGVMRHLPASRTVEEIRKHVRSKSFAKQLETVVHDRAHRLKIPCVAPHSHGDGEGDHSQKHSEPADETPSQRGPGSKFLRDLQDKVHGRAKKLKQPCPVPHAHPHGDEV